MLIGLVGKANVGKSTFLKAATLADVKIANYPFTTIDPNVATGYVTSQCPCKELGVKCNPQNSQCIDGRRLIPIQLIDVAGLVPGAHKGRGLGNKFLDDLRQASVLIHVLDVSGTTDEEGRPTKGYDPIRDVEFLEVEIREWFFGILKRALEKFERKIMHGDADVKQIVSEQVAGLGINAKQVEEVFEELGIEKLSLNELRNFSDLLLKKSKPILIAANKIDIEGAEDNFKRLKETYKDKVIIPTSADTELALRTAAKNGFIKYFPGDNDFEILKPLNEKQKEALEKIRSLLKRFGSTGVQRCLNESVFGLLGYVVVYPVENENKFTNKKGQVLPDALLMPPGSTPRDLAAAIHTDLAERFICAIDARTKRRLPADYKLKNGDVIKIVTRG